MCVVAWWKPDVGALNELNDSNIHISQNGIKGRCNWDRCPHYCVIYCYWQYRTPPIVSYHFLLKINLTPRHQFSFYAHQLLFLLSTEFTSFSHVLSASIRAPMRMEYWNNAFYGLVNGDNQIYHIVIWNK